MEPEVVVHGLAHLESHSQVHAAAPATAWASELPWVSVRSGALVQVPRPGRLPGRALAPELEPS